jgi:hypothetical protein
MGGTIPIQVDVMGSRLEWTYFALAWLGRWFTPVVIIHTIRVKGRLLATNDLADEANGGRPHPVVSRLLGQLIHPSFRNLIVEFMQGLKLDISLQDKFLGLRPLDGEGGTFASTRPSPRSRIIPSPTLGANETPAHAEGAIVIMTFIVVRSTQYPRDGIRVACIGRSEIQEPQKP